MRARSSAWHATSRGRGWPAHGGERRDELLGRRRRCGAGGLPTDPDRREDRRAVVGDDEPVAGAHDQFGVGDVADELEDRPLLWRGTPRSSAAASATRRRIRRAPAPAPRPHRGRRGGRGAASGRPTAARRDRCVGGHSGVLLHGRGAPRPVWSATLPGADAFSRCPDPRPDRLGLTLAPLRRGPADPTMRVGREIWRHDANARRTGHDPNLPAGGRDRGGDVGSGSRRCPGAGAGTARPRGRPDGLPTGPAPRGAAACLRPGLRFAR